MERKCCPFFDFGIEVARESGPVWLRLSGRRGVKDFLSQAFLGLVRARRDKGALRGFKTGTV